ncbi:MAG: cytochrome c-type biogenesis protein CcmH, partial [Candidatus Dadabacteria bacterium]|nr:cytochrome c-type biogenesis protein CcmH [Candidatus Dadabacteria bacterium]
ILAGQSDAEITDYLVTRYGDFVLYDPPIKGRTLLLWFGPFALLFIALLITVITAKRRQGLTSSPLTEDEEQKLKQLLTHSSKGE